MEQILNQTSDALSTDPTDKELWTKTRLYYDSCLDPATIESRGFDPIIPLAKRIVSKTESQMSVPALFAHLHQEGISAMFKTAFTKVENGSPKDLRLQFFPAPAYRVKVDTVKAVLEYFVKAGCLTLVDGLTLDDVAEWVHGLESEGVKFIKALK